VAYKNTADQIWFKSNKVRSMVVAVVGPTSDRFLTLQGNGYAFLSNFWPDVNDPAGCEGIVPGISGCRFVL
jgi:hypothetical protein